MIQIIKRKFFPTFEEWLWDFRRGLNKELQNPRVRELIFNLVERQKLNKHGGTKKNDRQT